MQDTRNRGAGGRQRIVAPDFPDADSVIRQDRRSRPDSAVDILFVNPPSPDGGIWIRSQHRVGRRSREGMIWPQVGLAQMAALFPDLRVDVVDAIASGMDWTAFERLLEELRPRYYVTQVTAPTLRNDMLGVFLAKSTGAKTIAFGTHVTPVPRQTMKQFPSLDFVLRGEPELTLRELVDTLERWNVGTLASVDCAQDRRWNVGRQKTDDGRWGMDSSPGASTGSPGSSEHAPDVGFLDVTPAEQRTTDPAVWWPGQETAFAERLERLFTEADPGWRPAWLQPDHSNLPQQLSAVKGLVWRREGEIVMNPDRPFIADLDDLPLPRHDLLPLEGYRAPLVCGPYAFVVTSRGCPAGCRFCIKHVSYGRSVRFRSPENILAELEQLVELGVRSVHMYADLFTVSREQVVGLCELILERNLQLRWTCNSRVDFVDADMLKLMGEAGCWMISWGIESGSEEILRRCRKGIRIDQVEQALRWAKDAGILNWGYFIIGLPGETEETIRETIRLSKKLPLDLALFHIAAPHPGSPFFFEVLENGWFRPGTQWEQVDMDRSTVLDYPQLRAEELERWAQRAFREWALRPGPMLTYLKMLLKSPELWRPALRIGVESLGWAAGKGGRQAESC